MLPNPSIDFDQQIAIHERRDLEKISPQFINLPETLDGLHFSRVMGLGDFWRDGTYFQFAQVCNDFITSAFSYQSWFTFIIAGTKSNIEVYFALEEAATIINLLKANFPGIRLDTNSIFDLGTRLSERLKYGGMVTGIPSMPKEIFKESVTEYRHLERLVRGMRDSSWLYIVQAYPRDYDDVRSERLALLDSISENASISKQQIQKSIQKGTHRADESVSEVISGEIINRSAEYVLELLETELIRLEQAQALGRWQVAVYYGAMKEISANRLGSLLAGIFSSTESRSQPIRIHSFRKSSTTQSEDFHTYLTSEELSYYIQLLREEYPGYAIHDFVQFDVDYVSSSSKCLNIGRILWDDSDTTLNYSLQTKELTKHGVVFGVTGSGKTTTIFNLLDQVFLKENIPFLVIEPAKTEYRALLGQIKNGLGSGPIPELRVFTLGNDSVAPFRINPFEFEISDKTDSAPVLSHIDYLKVVFNAAFILYAPMPYVLETALHEIYVDKGWDLATGTNARLGNLGWRQKDKFPIFPTLTDLYHKIEVVTSRLGYEARIEQDVIAGLKARIGALRLGSKGLMLDTARGNPIDELLSCPTVLELESIGNDDEKTFLIGLLLARIYGYRRIQAMEGKLDDRLQHLLVIEEAHRLLKNTSTKVEVEGVNLHAQAIETFVNILSEIRHYGQGVLVAEQIPAKLTPDVIKNTNLKIIHRLVAADDREVVASTMNMDEHQKDYLTTLSAGRAVAFSEGDDHPYLLGIQNYKQNKSLNMPTDSDLQKSAESYISLGSFYSIPDFESYGIKPSRFGQPDPTIYQTVLELLSQRTTPWVWARIIARTVYARQSLLELLDEIKRHIIVNPGNLTPNQISLAVNLLIVFGVFQAIQVRGSSRGWQFTKIDQLRDSLAHGLVKLFKTKNTSESASDLDRFVRNYSDALERESGPYSGCRMCKAICLYHEEVRGLLTKMDFHHVREALADPDFDKNDPASYGKVAGVLQGVVNQWLGEESVELKDISYCAGVTTLPSLGFNDFNQFDISKSLAKELNIL